MGVALEHVVGSAGRAQQDDAGPLGQLQAARHAVLQPLAVFDVQVWGQRPGDALRRLANQQRRSRLAPDQLAQLCKICVLFAPAADPDQPVAGGQLHGFQPGRRRVGVGGLGVVDEAHALKR